MKLRKEDMDPSDQILLEEGLFDEILKPIPRVPQPLEAADFIAGMRELAAALKSQPINVNVSPPAVTVNVTPSIEVTAKIPPTVERTRIIRDEKNPLKIVGSVKETEEKP